MVATWSLGIGIVILIISVIIATILYLNYKKIYYIIYTLSISTYIFSVFYGWDVMNWSKNTVLIILVISSILMIYLGNHFKKIEYNKSKKIKTNQKNKILYFFLILILMIIFGIIIYCQNFNLKENTNFYNEITLNKSTLNFNKINEYYNLKIGTLTIENENKLFSIEPKMPIFHICLLDKNKNNILPPYEIIYPDYFSKNTNLDIFSSDLIIKPNKKITTNIEIELSNKTIKNLKINNTYFIYVLNESKYYINCNNINNYKPLKIIQLNII